MKLNIVSLVEATEEYGGKALGLAQLFSYGMPVPNGSALSPDFVEKIAQQPYDKINLDTLEQGIRTDKGCLLAVRSSALNEDGAENSFAGIYDTVLSVPADSASIARAVVQVYSGQNSARAASYRSDRKISTDICPQLGIVIQEMIEPAIAGVAFSFALGVDGQPIMLLECVEGLGNKLVSGEVTPTRVEIPLDSNQNPDANRAIATGKLLNMTGIGALAELVAKSAQAAKKDLDIEWAIDTKGQPWLLQARPITKTVLVPAQAGTQAVPASSGLAKGTAFVVEEESDLDTFPDSAVLVAQVTETNYLPAMRRAAAVVTEEGGLLSHAAIVSREIGIPCVVGYSDARKYFPTGTIIQVDGTSGIINNESVPGNVSANVRKQDVDWGASYLFEYIIPVRVGDVTGLFNPTPTGLALHLSTDISAVDDEKFEIFSRKNFATSPRRYQSDKYLWYFEWERFQSNEVFRYNLRQSQKVVETFDSLSLSRHYNSLITSGKRFVSARYQAKDAAFQFLLDETLLSYHFLLTMLIPEGYALKAMYVKVQPLLERSGLTFTDIIAGDERVSKMDPTLGEIALFSQTVSQIRNGIYKRLVKEGIARDDYFEDRNSRAEQAISSMHLPYKSGDDPVSVFYSAITQVPAFSNLMQFGQTPPSNPQILS